MAGHGQSQENSKSQTGTSQTSLPNIVIILADDFGYGSTNATGAPESLVKTTNLNRLTSEGKRFTNAYTASSVCSPTRYALSLVDTPLEPLCSAVY